MVNIQLRISLAGPSWDARLSPVRPQVTVPEKDARERFTRLAGKAIDLAMPRIKLTEKQRIALIAEYLSGARIDFLANKYGVHRSYPRQLFKRHAKAAELRISKAA